MVSPISSFPQPALAAWASLNHRTPYYNFLLVTVNKIFNNNEMFKTYLPGVQNVGKHTIIFFFQIDDLINKNYPTAIKFKRKKFAQMSTTVYIIIIIEFCGFPILY